MKTLLPVLLGCCGITLAGPFVFPGQHPNYDAQFSEDLVREYPEANLLNQQFPQYSFVYQPPLIGYLSPVNPAALIVWTTLRLPYDPFEQSFLDGEPGPFFPEEPGEPPPPNPPPPPDPPPPPPGGEIPEPSTVWMAITGIAFGIVGKLLMNRAAAGTGRGGDHA